ncbi:MAG: YiiX/YebB-like N1pC/P60 family cysteine hydrolase [Methylotetracoccus sp.]
MSLALRRRTRHAWRIIATVAAALLGSACSPPLYRSSAGLSDSRTARNLCERHTHEVHTEWSTLRTSVDDEIDAFKQTLTRALTYRAEAVATAARARETISRNAPLSGAEIAALERGSAEHLAVRDELYRVASSHECWVDDGLSAPTGSGFPDDVRLKGVMLSIAAALVLYDNYLFAVALYEQPAKLRRIQDARDIGYDIEPGELTRSSLAFASPENRRRLRRAIAYFQASSVTQAGLIARDERTRYLQMLIAQSPSYRISQTGSGLEVWKDRIELFGVIGADSLARIRDSGTNMLSALFGDTLGLVASRAGKLADREDVARDLEAVLEPGDILLEKTPFRLTNAFIPGFWGHAALWAGTERDMRVLGIWDHPVVRRHQETLRQHRVVAEALRSGVQLNTLRHFLNIDDLAVLRPRETTPAIRAAVVVEALRQVGKRYDFNFDVETSDRIVCSELIYKAYTGLRWPTSRVLGRVTISPDQIAARGLRGGPLRIVRLYRGGRRIAEDAEAIEALLPTGRGARETP